MKRKIALGDVVTITGKYCKNPKDGKDTEYLQFFLVTKGELDGYIAVNGVPGTIQISDVCRT